MRLLLSFTIHLDNYEIDQLVRPNGPLFHRWLPDGEADAVVIHTKDNRDRIKLWFERRGHVDNDFIRYDKKRNEVDDDIMSRQGHLDAGQLWGECQYAHLTQAELEAVRNDRTESKDYFVLAKRVARFLQSNVSAFIDMLRTQYGQYWLPELRPWDSRTQSLGSYCSTTLWLRWRENEEEQWRKFGPDPKSAIIYAEPLPGRAYGEYLTESDWRRIQSTFPLEGPIPLALRLAARAHELREAGHEREAFIQAVTALELAMRYFVDERLNKLDKEVESDVKKILDLPIKYGISLLAVFTNLVELPVLLDTRNAVDMRHGIVHEGKEAYDPGRQMLLAVLACIKGLLGLEELKTPVLFAGNMLSAPGDDRQLVVSGGVTITDMSAKDGVEGREVRKRSEEID